MVPRFGGDAHGERQKHGVSSWELVLSRHVCWSLAMDRWSGGMSAGVWPWTAGLEAYPLAVCMGEREREARLVETC